MERMEETRKAVSVGGLPYRNVEETWNPIHVERSTLRQRKSPRSTPRSTNFKSHGVPRRHRGAAKCQDHSKQPPALTVSLPRTPSPGPTSKIQSSEELRSAHVSNANSLPVSPTFQSVRLPNGLSVFLDSIRYSESLFQQEEINSELVISGVVKEDRKEGSEVVTAPVSFERKRSKACKRNQWFFENFKIGRKRSSTKNKPRALISVQVLGSSGPLLIVVDENDVVEAVIERLLKTYAKEGRKPVLGLKRSDYDLYYRSLDSDTERLDKTSRLSLADLRKPRLYVLCRKSKSKRDLNDNIVSTPKNTELLMDAPCRNVCGGYWWAMNTLVMI